MQLFWGVPQISSLPAALQLSSPEEEKWGSSKIREITERFTVGEHGEFLSQCTFARNIRALSYQVYHPIDMCCQLSYHHEGYQPVILKAVAHVMLPDATFVLPIVAHTYQLGAHATISNNTTVPITIFLYNHYTCPYLPACCTCRQERSVCGSISTGELCTTVRRCLCTLTFEPCWGHVAP